jgi:hypothetical protein
VTIAGTGAGFVTTNLEGTDDTAMYCSSGTCTETYRAGQSVTLLATSNSGATFTGWSGTGCSGASTTCTVSADATVTATFASSGTAGGTVQFPQASYAALPGKTTTITISRTGNTDNAASVNIACTGSSCSLFPTSVEFVSGQSSASFSVSVPAGSSGTAQLTLSAGTGSPTIGGTGVIKVNFKKSVNLTPILMLLLD